jgi:hypothetical protein
VNKNIKSLTMKTKNTFFSSVILLIACCVVPAFSFAQAPQAFKYQSIVRDVAGNPMASSAISIRASVHDLTATGTIVYQETHTVTTNSFGLINLELGNGTIVIGTFNSIAWGTGSKWMEIEADLGSGYVTMGTSQLLSVPYALYSGNGTPGADGATGNTGATGAAGIDGTNGLAGDIGATGVAGATGAAGTNGTNGTTGATGTAGTNGINGSTGATGTAGTNGINGATGATGTAGTNGINGNTGATGTQGNTGATGSNGIAGATGSAGTNGTNGTNGSTGATGTNGINGATGATGTAGTNGINGNTGTTGTQGNTGATGSNGIAGATGSAGTNGNTGATGTAGTNGTNGTNGSTGATGTAGINGTDGTTGATGIDGAIGATGFLSSGTAAGNTPYWNGTSWITNSSNIFNNGSNVGIGAPAPSYPFHVYGTSVSSYLSYFDAAGTSASSLFGLGVNATATGSGDAFSIQGISSASSGNSYGAYFQAQGGGAGIKVGTESYGNGSTVGNFGVRGFANGTTTGTNYGIYGSAQNGATNWAGYFASGNVFIQNSLGIGISPAARLQVRGLTGSSSTSYAFRAENSLGNTLMVIRDDGFVGIGTTTGYKLSVNGSVGIPSANTYRYNTPKTKKYKVGVADLTSANPSVYDKRIDEGFSSGTVNGLNQLWAATGTPGIVAYFVAPLHLPDSAIVTGLAAQLVKNGGSLQSVIEVYRTDGTGYLNNTAQLIATCTTVGSGGGVAYVNASSVNSSYNVIDNTNYYYFIRWSGEQGTQNVRFVNCTLNYQIYRSEY